MKGNLWLGTSHGSLGDVVSYQSGGETISRKRVRQIANPRTVKQMLQRVVLKTVSSAYSALYPIVSQSFQGVSSGRDSQRRFNKRNLALMRTVAVQSYTTAGGDLSEMVEGNFVGASSLGAALNPYIVSEGSLTRPFTFTLSTSGPIGGINLAGFATGNTYEMVINALGVQAGDQLTFVDVLAFSDSSSSSTPEVITKVNLARRILMPDTGNLQDTFIANDGTVNKGNSEDEGTLLIDDALLVDAAANYDSDYVHGVAVILSRKVNDSWQYSTERLVMSSNYAGVALALNTAIRTYLANSLGSDLYLQQAE